MQLSAELKKHSLVTAEILDPMYIYLPSFHPEKGTDHSSFAIAILTVFQHLFYFLQDSNYFKGLIFKNKDHPVIRILLETLRYEMFSSFCPVIWHLATLVPLSQVTVFVYVFSDHRLAKAPGLQMLIQEISSSDFSGTSCTAQVHIHIYIQRTEVFISEVFKTNLDH